MIMNKINYDIEIDRSLIQTEEEMLARWGHFDKPLVSICCIAYNHEKYITDTLDGFLIQKNNFPVEILVHDDASTDRTADIIREYEKRYPHIIKPIYQTVNQYSQGKRISLFNFERAQGKYIAMCEGDDYWFDPQKLQVQHDILEKFDCASMVVHPSVQILYIKDKKHRSIVGFHGKKNGLIDGKKSFYQISQFSPTSSYMFRKKYMDIFINFMKNVNPTCGDFFIEAINCSDRFFYFCKPMSVYRRGQKGSYSFLSSRQGNKVIYKNYKRNIEALKALNIFPWISKNMISVRMACIRLDTLFFLFRNMIKLLSKAKNSVLGMAKKCMKTK